MEAYKPGVTIPIHYLMHGVNTVLSTLHALRTLDPYP